MTILNSARINDTMAPKLVNMEQRIRMDLLYRLRWDLLAGLHDIEIAVGPENAESVVVLFDQPCVDEDIAEPGLRRVEVCSDECLRRYENSFDGSPEPDGYQPPPSLFIEAKDGGFIALKQFVTEVHAYLNEHMDHVKSALRQMYTSSVNERIYFRRIWARGKDDNDVRLSVSLLPKLNSAPMEQHWASHLHYARQHGNKRQGLQ
jgi:hypothetical protein